MFKAIFPHLLLAALTISVSIAQPEPGKTDSTASWHGYRAEYFTLDGKQARLVSPEIPAPGKPWVWRARFPNWHYQMDSILLGKGYHIAYINTDNMYGSPAAMEIWDGFYDYLTSEKNLSEKVVLEGVSRGGLFIYNWAKKNPEKVNCIYAEAPVCDFKSWPLGNGKGIGSKTDWQRLLKVYGFKSEKKALKYYDNPVDHLEKLAKAKVPVLHMIGLQDEVVPPEENTFVLVDRYIKLGGPAAIFPNTLHKQGLSGHHFPIDNIAYATDFIISNTSRYKHLLPSSEYHSIRTGIPNAFKKFRETKKGTVAFLGGSITYNPGWRDSICHYLQRRFPDTEFTFIPAGIPSQGSIPGAFRLEQDVLSKEPIDLLFEEAAVNDAYNGRIKARQIRAMEGIARHVWHANTATDIVFMYFVDPRKMETYRKGNVPDVILNHDYVAMHYGIPAINLAKEVTDRIDNGEFTWNEDFKNLHPSPFGQKVYFHSMRVFLDTCLALAEKTTAHVRDSLPPPLDPFNYSDGKLIPVSDVNPGKFWTLEENWHPQDSAKTREGFVHVPVLVADLPGARMAYKFEGTAVGLVVIAGPDAGKIKYCIDSTGNPQTLDLYTKWSKNLHLPWYYVLADDLEPGPHTLILKTAEEKNPESKGNACRIRYFFVNE